ncbi:MAG: alpha/beta hydrolase [Rhodobiaceae bacterium]|nr:alpha/beta hydrolase [Rhodobiaceae bacterium]
MAAFLLIHGAWHDERCWELLVPQLAARGHAVHTLTLPGHWNRPLPSYQISLGRYGEAICEAARQIGEPVTLVGHSMGGMAISRAAEMQPNLFDELVYLTAYLPRLNKWTRMRSLALSDEKTQLWPAVRTDWFRFRAHIRPELAAETFYHDCPKDLADLAAKRLCSQSGLPIVEFGRITHDGAGSRPMTYIECLQDRVISLDLQKQMQEHAPFKQVLTLDSSHSPFLSQPTALAEMLHGIVGGRTPKQKLTSSRHAKLAARKRATLPPLAEVKAG